MVSKKKLDKRKVEEIAVNTVKDRLGACRYVTEDIFKNDKTPLYDGEITVYSSPEFSNNTLYGTLKVQVRGSQNVISLIERARYRFDVPVLNYYKNQGGVFFFLVYVSNAPLIRDIYYETLTPERIKWILEGLKPNQKTVLVEIKQFPKNDEDMAEIFLNHIMNSRKQIGFSNSPTHYLSDLGKRIEIEKVTKTVIKVGTEQPNFRDVIFNDEIVLYAKIKNVDLEFPVRGGFPEPLEKGLTKIGISANGKMLETRWQELHWKDCVEFHRGDSLKLIMNLDPKPFHLSYSPDFHLSKFLDDFEIVLSFFDADALTIHGNEIKIPKRDKTCDQDSYDKFIYLLSHAKKIKELLSTIGISRDVDLLTVNKEDMSSIDLLYQALVEKKSVPVPFDEGHPLISYNILGFNLLLVLTKDPDNENLTIIQDFFDTELEAISKYEDGTQFASSQYSFLRYEDILSFDNIKLDKLLPSFMQFTKTMSDFNSANNMLLTLLDAFDNSNSLDKSIKIINTAFDFSKCLISDTFKTKPSKIDAMVNHLQVIKRMRPLNDEELDFLRQSQQINGIEWDTKLAILLLLDELESANSIFSSLSEDEKEYFLDFPISIFLKKQNE